MTRRIDRIRETGTAFTSPAPQWGPERTLLEEAVSQAERLHSALGLPVGVSLIFDPSPRIEVPPDALGADVARALEAGATAGVPVTVAVNDDPAEHEPRS